MMQDIGRWYVPYFNKGHERTGGLWEGRYRSFPIDTVKYFLTCLRYVDLNPVRAGIVSSPDEYRWSSYRTNALGIESLLVERHPVFDELGVDDVDRCAKYRALCGPPLTDEELTLIRDAAHYGWPLGEPDFLARVEARCGRPVARRPPGRRCVDETPVLFECGV
jgi:putative transposase